MEKEDKLREYNKNYYQQHKIERRHKIRCNLCGRQVASDYLKKHIIRGICKKNKIRGNPVDPFGNTFGKGIFFKGIKLI